MIYPEETNDNTNFIITDNSSEIAKIFPDNWIEPLTIIARVEGYKGIDDYVIRLIKDRLEMFTDTRDELGEDFQKYIHNMILGKDSPNKWAASKEEEEQSNNENASKFVKQVNEEYHHDMKHPADDKEKEDLK